MNSATQAVLPEIENGIENRLPYYWYTKEALSEEDTESIYSVQDKETDFVHDSSDLEEASSDTTGEPELEYEVASLSGDDDENMDGFLSSSGTEDFSTVAIAAVLCDSSLEAWATDVESGTSSSDSEDSSFVDLRKDYWTCIQCKLQKDNPVFRYCDKCFQQRCWQCKTKKSFKCFPLCENCFKVRKTLFPPPPRGNRKRKLEKQAQPRVHLDTLQSCLKNLTQDSPQKSETLPGLDFNKIIVPEHLRKRTASESTDSSEEPPSKLRRLQAENVERFNSDYSDTCRKTDDARPDSRLSNVTQQSEFSQSDILSQPSSSQQTDSGISSSAHHTDSGISSSHHTDSGISSSHQTDSGFSSSSLSSILPPIEPQQGKDLCILCNTNPKNGIFIHSRVAHMCCCYSCSLKTWKINKKCPMCNCKVSKVVQVFTG